MTCTELYMPVYWTLHVPKWSHGTEHVLFGTEMVCTEMDRYRTWPTPCRCMASNSNTNEKAECCSSQMARKRLGHFLEGQSNKWRGQSQNWTTKHGWHTQEKKDSASLAMWYEWITMQRIPRQALHWEIPGFERGPGPPRTNWRGTVNNNCKGRKSPGRKQRWQLKTDQNNVEVWLNASNWMRVKSRSRSKSTYAVYC